MLAATACLANNMSGIEVRKNVNDGYTMKVPVWLDAQSQLPFLPGAYLRSEMVFTAPRGEFFGAMGRLNHSNFRSVIGWGFTLLGWRCEFETGGTNWFEGNNESVPAGLVMDNAFRTTVEW